MLRICFLLLSLCSVAQGVIPSYLPASRTSQNERDKIITDYFYLGLSYAEIVSFLLLYHGIHISLRHLKRILRQIGLKRRKNHSHASDIINAVEIELTRVGRIGGYRQMHKILRDDYKLVVDRETVRLVLQHLDPEGVLSRQKHRLQRRIYTSKGPNYIWHIDGYDKLKPFGFCIHGCIDGYSRRIMWLEVTSTNNDPAIIAKYYTAVARQIKGVPRVIRSDLGTENVTVAGLQRYFRADAADDFAGVRSFLYGKSVSNQRIEAWWSIFKKSHTSWWINYFKDLRDSGVVDLTDELQKACLQFCFTTLLQKELHTVARHWNTHRIRHSNNRECPPGKPDVLYFLPELEDTTDYKTPIDMDDIDIVEDTCCKERNPYGCPQEFSDVFLMLMDENEFSMPDNIDQAELLYLNLLALVHHIL